MRRSTGTALLLLLAGCTADSIPLAGDAMSGGPESGAPEDASPPVDMSAPNAPADLAFESVVASRPYMSKIPATYDPRKSWPLVILLHGYTASGAIQDGYFGLGKIVDSKGFLYAYPDGKMDAGGNRYWNATDACCDLYGSKVDDVAYINAIISDMSAKYSVDPKRVFLIGHSNGAFMAHRLACDSAARVAAIVALAGDNWLDVSLCKPSVPVAVLQVHGDADAVINYNGGANLGHFYPSAPISVGDWQQLNHCGAQPTAGAPLDLVVDIPGPETTPSKYAGCTANGAAELWTIHGGSHIPNFQPVWASVIYDWLMAHPKP